MPTRTVAAAMVTAAAVVTGAVVTGAGVVVAGAGVEAGAVVTGAGVVGAGAGVDAGAADAAATADVELDFDIGMSSKPSSAGDFLSSLNLCLCMDMHTKWCTIFVLSSFALARNHFHLLRPSFSPA